MQKQWSKWSRNLYQSWPHLPSGSILCWILWILAAGGITIGLEVHMCPPEVSFRSGAGCQLTQTKREGPKTWVVDFPPKCPPNFTPKLPSNFTPIFTPIFTPKTFLTSNSFFVKICFDVKAFFDVKNVFDVNNFFDVKFFRQNVHQILHQFLRQRYRQIFHQMFQRLNFTQMFCRHFHTHLYQIWSLR